MKNHTAVQQGLLARYNEIQDRLARIEGDRRHTGKPLEQDFEEQAIEVQNDEVLDALDGSIRLEMAQIQRTLTRLEAGTYGLCESCGQPIAGKRLQALPHATRCVSCAEAAPTR